MQQLGIGLGAAVLIDATIIRGILLPATMKLLGDWNWYLPSKLGWLPTGEPGAGGDARRPRRPHHTTTTRNRAPAGARFCVQRRVAQAPARRPDSIAPSMKPGPPVREVGAGEDHVALRPAHRGVMVLVPAGAMDRPGPAGELVGEPVVRRDAQDLVAGQVSSRLACIAGQIGRVAALSIEAEADHQLSPVVEQNLAAQVAEGMFERIEFCMHGLAARVDHHLDPAAGLAELDRPLLVLRQRRAELDPAERVQRDGHDRGARDERLAPLACAPPRARRRGAPPRPGWRAAARTPRRPAMAASSAPVPPSIVTRPPVNWVSSRL